MSDFDDWYNGPDGIIKQVVSYRSAKLAWEHQQQRIEELKKMSAKTVSAFDHMLDEKDSRIKKLQTHIEELDRKYQKQCGVNMVLKARIANLTGENHE